MKKLIASMLTILMVMTLLAGCASNANDDSSKETITSESSTTKEESSETSQEASKQAAETDSTTAAESVELTILAAASLTDVTKELADLYKEVEPDVTLTFSYGASGALQTQIEEGAPADIFMSAATKQMDALAEENLLAVDTRKDLLVNKVVLIKPLDSELELTSFKDVASDQVKSVALGEPEGVPVGQYAKQVFTNLGIEDVVEAKANYGSDVKQVLTWVESGEVDCGVVYSTDAMISDKISVVCEAPEDSHEAIIYPVAVLDSSLLQEQAKAFIDFLSTEDAVASFEKYGFSMK